MTYFRRYAGDLVVASVVQAVAAAAWLASAREAWLASAAALAVSAAVVWTAFGAAWAVAAAVAWSAFAMAVVAAVVWPAFAMAVGPIFEAGAGPEVEGYVFCYCPEPRQLLRPLAKPEGRHTSSRCFYC
jgi:hypothetical protein